MVPISFPSHFSLRPFLCSLFPLPDPKPIYATVSSFLSDALTPAELPQQWKARANQTCVSWWSLEWETHLLSTSFYVTLILDFFYLRKGWSSQISVCLYSARWPVWIILDLIPNRTDHLNVVVTCLIFIVFLYTCFLKILIIFNCAVLEDLEVCIRRDLDSEFTLPTFYAKGEILFHNPITLVTSSINYYFGGFLFIFSIVLFFNFSKSQLLKSGKSRIFHSVVHNGLFNSQISVTLLINQFFLVTRIFIF